MALSYYVIPLDKNLETEHMHNAIKLVNHMLGRGVDVRWLQKGLRGEKRNYQKGDFIIILNSKKNLEYKNKITINYLLKTAEELEVTVYQERRSNESSLVTAAQKIVKPEIVIYYGNGTTDGAIWFVQALEKMGFDIGIVTENDILKGALENYNVLIVGSGMYYCRYLGEEGCKKIEEFVYNGGGYIGHCGGSVAAVKGYPKSSSSSWLELADVRLELKENGNLLSSYVRGPVIYSITMPEHPILFGYEGKVPLVYWWGPIFSSEVGENVSVVATISGPSPDIQTSNPEITRIDGIMPSIEELNESSGKPAILAANYGHGKVVVVSPHPEIPGSEHAYRLVANEVFFVTSSSASLRHKQHSTSDFKKECSSNNIAKLEALLREIKVAEEIVQGFADKDARVYGTISESMLLYLVDSIDRLEKITNFAKQAIAIDKINRLTESETMEVVKNTITFLSEHRNSLNKTLDLRDRLKGRITDEYTNLMKMEFSSYKEALNAYKYGVGAKILDTSFAVTRAKTVNFYSDIFK